jgi:hypothetical protein
LESLAAGEEEQESGGGKEEKGGIPENQAIKEAPRNFKVYLCVYIHIDTYIYCVRHIPIYIHIDVYMHMHIYGSKYIYGCVCKCTYIYRIQESKREEQENLKNKAAGDLFNNKKIKFTNGTSKIIRPKFAVGGLDQDMMDWGGMDICIHIFMYVYIYMYRYV